MPCWEKRERERKKKQQHNSSLFCSPLCLPHVHPRLSLSRCLVSTHRLQGRHCESQGESASAKCVYINVNALAVCVCASEIDECCALQSARTPADIGKCGLFNQRHTMEARGRGLVPPVGSSHSRGRGTWTSPTCCHCFSFLRWPCYFYQFVIPVLVLN